MDGIPQRLQDVLLPFQKDGVKFAIEKNGRCLIADEMGLGKTLQALAVATYYRREWPLLIIVPSSIKYAWIEELERWLPQLDPRDINLIMSGMDVSGIHKASVTIATYGLLSKTSSKLVVEALSNLKFGVVIADESHYLRNQKTSSCQVASALIHSANRRILLSGTPALSRPVELFAQIDSILPGHFGTWWDFTTRFCAARYEFFGRMRRRNVRGASNLGELQSWLSSSVMIRREKKQVLPQLPPKQRQKVLFALKQSPQKSELEKLFEELRPSMKRATSLTAGNTSNTPMLGRIQKLYNLSCHAKIGPVTEYVRLLCDNHQLKFLVFAHHHAMLDAIERCVHDAKVKSIRIDGATRATDRLYYVQQFQADPDCRVAILSILAAGVGLTFTAASLVVFAEMHWTPGMMVQCEDRAHRIGQAASVSVHYLVAKDTMDEWVWSTINKKTAVVTVALNGRRESLEAYRGDRYQIDVLSNADAAAPTTITSQGDRPGDVSSFFHAHENEDQMSILDFFAKNGDSRADSRRAAKFKKTGHESGMTKRAFGGVSKRQRVESVDEIVISSDDEDVFDTRRKKKKVPTATLR